MWPAASQAGGIIGWRQIRRPTKRGLHQTRGPSPTWRNANPSPQSADPIYDWFTEGFATSPFSARPLPV